MGIRSVSPYRDLPTLISRFCAIHNAAMTMRKLTRAEFNQSKRAPLFSYELYAAQLEQSSDGIALVTQSLNQDPALLAEFEVTDFMGATRQRAIFATDLLAVSFSAGHPIVELRTLYPKVLAYWECYAKYSRQYNETQDEGIVCSAHIFLKEPEFIYANQLTCFGILLGWPQLLGNLQELIAFNNPEPDGMLDRLLSLHVHDQLVLSDTCTRHLPYYKTLKIFSAAESERPTLMADYLADWYVASRREPYYDSHKQPDLFHGYWSWESAAITVALGIDDALYERAEFYPGELVKFARRKRPTVG